MRVTRRTRREPSSVCLKTRRGTPSKWSLQKAQALTRRTPALVNSPTGQSALREDRSRPKKVELATKANSHLANTRGLFLDTLYLKLDDIPLFDDIFLPFCLHEAFFACRSVRTSLEECLPVDHFCTDKLFFEISMNGHTCNGCS